MLVVVEVKCSAVKCVWRKLSLLEGFWSAQPRSTLHVSEYMYLSLLLIGLLTVSAISLNCYRCLSASASASMSTAVWPSIQWRMRHCMRNTSLVCSKPRWEGMEDMPVMRTLSHALPHRTHHTTSAVCCVIASCCVYDNATDANWWMISNDGAVHSFWMHSFNCSPSVLHLVLFCFLWLSCSVPLCDVRLSQLSMVVAVAVWGLCLQESGSGGAVILCDSAVSEWAAALLVC